MLKAGTAARRHALTWPQAHTPDDVRRQVAALMRGVDKRLQQHKAHWVGHVKVLISGGGTTIYGSITTADDQPRWSGSLNCALSHADLTIYAAIYTLTDAQVAAAIDGALAQQPVSASADERADA